MNDRDWSPYNATFQSAKLVQVENFINDTVGKRIVEMINFDAAKVSYNKENTLDKLGQLKSVNLNKNDEKGAKIKQHYVISGTQVTKQLPYLRHLYHSCFKDHVSKIVGVEVYPCEEMKTLNNTVIIYANENDSIRWHVDKSIFNGKRVFTLLIYLYNKSTQELCYIHDAHNVKQCLHTPENSCVLLEHFVLQHGVTPLKQDEKRIVWSMTFAELPTTNSVSGYTANKIKNYSYLGIEALSMFDIFVVSAAIVIVLCITIVLLIKLRK